MQVIGAGKKAKPVLVRGHNDNAGNLSLSLTHTHTHTHTFPFFDLSRLSETNARCVFGLHGRGAAIADARISEYI